MEFENKIRKKCDLENNDSISIYQNWAAQQHYDIFEVFHNFLNKIKPSQILEIGTSLGGFTSFLNYTIKKCEINCKILSYDIHEHNWYNEMRSNGIDLRIENVFKENYTEVKQEVIDYIKEDGTTLILCDGGNKVGEFNLLSNYIKRGDIIMAHDYAENELVFKNKIYMKKWNWHEISDKDIQDACIKNNLISYNKNIFDDVVWVCKIKE